jgi:hypothetical protein
VVLILQEQVHIHLIDGEVIADAVIVEMLPVVSDDVDEVKEDCDLARKSDGIA